jgi:hypothetical protein
LSIDALAADAALPPVALKDGCADEAGLLATGPCSQLALQLMGAVVATCGAELGFHPTLGSNGGAAV